MKMKAGGLGNLLFCKGRKCGEGEGAVLVSKLVD